MWLPLNYGGCRVLTTKGRPYGISARSGSSTNSRTFYGQTRPTAFACMTSSLSGSDQKATNNKRATAGKGKAMEAQRNKILSSKKTKTVISHLLEDDITDESDIDCETNSD